MGITGKEILNIFRGQNCNPAILAQLQAPNITIMLREGVQKKPIESVIMIIPHRTPPPLFFENCDRLRFFFCDVFLINWVIQVCPETRFGYV